MKLFVFAAGFGCWYSVLAAQPAKDPAAQKRATDPTLWMMNAEEHDPLVPIAEQERKQKFEGPVRNTQSVMIPPPAPKETQFAPAGTVSARALKNPLSSKGRKLVEKAQDQVRKQDYEAAKKTLDGAMKLDDARPYAMAISGSIALTQYIRSNDPKKLSVALAALIEAAPFLSDDAAAHSNLGLAYYFAGDEEQALREASRALQMDPARAKTRYVMGVILANQHRYSEAAYHLKIAASEMNAANDLLQRVQQLATEHPTREQN